MINVNMMGFRKLLSLFRAKNKLPIRETQPETRFFLPQKTVAPTKIIMLPPTPIQKLDQSYTPEPALIPEEPSREKTSETEDEELCEEPQPFQPFHAVSVEVARRKAAEKGLLILFKERERWDLYNRKNVYISIPPEFAIKLLRLETDMRGETEFTTEELVVVKDLVLKGWLKKLQNGGTYYHGLNRKTAMILKKQMSQTF